jgi:replication initiation and membrane attachment protein DnaB
LTPFEYYSTRETLPYFNTFVYGTYQLKPMPDGKTRLSLLTSRAFGNKWAEWFMNLVMKNMIARQFSKQTKKYIESIQSDWATKQIEQGPMQLDVHQAALKMLTRTSE